MARSRVLSITLGAGAGLVLLALVAHVGPRAIAAAVGRITWWQLALICVVHGVSVIVDSAAWRYTLPPGRTPPFHRLLAAWCAGEALNVLTALGTVGGEAAKAWLVRRDVPYEASVPSLVLAKTALIVAQALLLVVATVVAWTTGAAGWVPGALGALLLVETIGVGGFLLVQVTGVVGRAGPLLAWVAARTAPAAQQLDEALRGFYRRRWRLFLASTGLYLVSSLIGVVEAFIILRSLGLAASLDTAMIVEALESGVSFATFFVPAGLGAVEGANAAGFTALGWAASAGLAFTLVRRARQAAWVAIGVGAWALMDARRALAARGTSRRAFEVDGAFSPARPRPDRSA